MNTLFHELGAAEIASGVASGRWTARAVAEAALDRLGSTHSRLNAFTLVTSQRALAEADAVDAALADGRPAGPLAGVPYSVKNLFDLAGEVTLAGSRIQASAGPAGADATAVRRLSAAGAVCLGAVNMGEYAYDFVTENAHVGATRNPHDGARSAGGSSGGSAASVAAGVVPLSLGTDTNGSIRVPSSLCGTWGLKPTYGRLSRAGAFPFVGSLDHIGPFARSVRDLALCYDVMQGPDDQDPVCTGRPAEPVSATLERGLEGLRLGVLGSYFTPDAGGPAERAVQRVATALGATRVVELPHVEAARAAAFAITACEGGQLHLPRLRTRLREFDPAARDRLIAGALLPASHYLQAQRFRCWWRDVVRSFFRDVDVLLAPATPVAATRIGQETMRVRGSEVLVRPNLGVYTQPISFLGLPVVAAPVPESDGVLPIAVQLIGAPWSEGVLLRVARVLEAQGVCASPVVLRN